jgi:hypothetical protein
MPHPARPAHGRANQFDASHRRPLVRLERHLEVLLVQRLEVGRTVGQARDLELGP